MVQFRPEEAVDYAYDLEFETEREKFMVPLRGFGPQPKLQMPQQCDFGKIVACYKSERTMMVRNIGDKVGTVTLSSSGPYSVLPSEITLQPSDAVQVY